MPFRPDTSWDGKGCGLGRCYLVMVPFPRPGIGPVASRSSCRYRGRAECFAVGVFNLVVPAQLLQGDGKVEVGVGVIGFVPYRLAVGCDGFYQVCLIVKGEAELEVDLGIVGFESDCLTVFGDGLVAGFCEVNRA